MRSRKDGEAQSDGWELPPRARGSVPRAEDRSAPGELGLRLSEGRGVRVVWRSGATPSLEVQCPFSLSDQNTCKRKHMSTRLLPSFSVSKRFLPLRPSSFL